MSYAGKLIKDIFKAKKESAKYEQQVKEEVLNEDTLLLKYIRSLGFSPEFMTFAQRSSYARSNAFKQYKQGHTFDKVKQNLKSEDVSEEVEKLDEAGTGLLMSFIKSKGLNPLTMDGNQKRAYSRSSEFRIFKMRHVKEESFKPMDTPKYSLSIQARQKEADKHNKKPLPWETDAEAVKREKENKSNFKKPDNPNRTGMDTARALAQRGLKEADAGEYDYEGAMAKTLLQTICRNAEALKDMLKDDENLPEWVQSKITKAEDYITTSLDYMKSTDELDEEVEEIEELSTDLLGRYKKAAGAQASAADKAGDYAKGNKRFSGIMKATKKQFANDTKQGVAEDLRKWFSKTNPEGDWKRINSKGDAVGPCAREPGEPKPKCMSKETRSELSKSERAAAVATKRKNDPVADRAGKGGKPVNVSNYGKGKLSEDEVDEACWDTHKKVGMKMKGDKMVPDCVPKNEEVEQIDEKNSPTNPALWSRAKSMARSKFDVYPSAYANGWASKWYKSKGGDWKSVSEDVVQEGIGDIEDSPMSTTNSVKSMESEHRKKNMKSARIIKSIYKNKGKNENMYGREKTDGGNKTPTAKITLQGGTTMTGKPRDTVEIEPVLNTRTNSQKQ